MAKLIKKAVRTGETKTYETKVWCLKCGSQISSLSRNCSRCGGTRKVKYDPKTETENTRREITGENLEKVKSGAQPCVFCETLTWNFDDAKNGYVCDRCGGSKKTVVPDSSGQELPESTSAHVVNHPTQKTAPEARTNDFEEPRKSVPTWVKIGGLAIGAILLLWLVISLFSAHEVRGYVSSVYWERSANQNELVLKNGEGFNPPANAVIQGSRPEYYGDQPNQVGVTYGSYMVTSTPEVVGYEQGKYYVTSTPEVVDVTYGEAPLIETPGAYFYGPEYDCGDPTPEAGGSVTYEQCADLFQEDSTYGYGEPEPTYVYAPVVDVEMTTEETPVYSKPVDIARTAAPTPVYGTPTPIYKEYYTYSFWEWVTIESLTTNGFSNEAYWPEGQNDDLHMVEPISEFYKIVIKYDNGKEKVYEGSDPSLLTKYLLEDEVIGRFNIFGGFLGDNK